MKPNVYREHVKQMGSASAVTIYLSKVPSKYVLHVEHLAACVYTTNPGDYTTSKFIWLGFEVGGNKHYLEGHDINATNSVLKGVVSVKDFTIPADARLFAYFEATATTVEYELAATGLFCKKEAD